MNLQEKKNYMMDVFSWVNKLKKMGNENFWLKESINEMIFRLIDELANFREYVYEKHPESKVLDVSRPSLADRVRFVLSKFVAVSSDMAVLKYLTKDLKN